MGYSYSKVLLILLIAHVFTGCGGQKKVANNAGDDSNIGGPVGSNSDSSDQSTGGVVPIGDGIEAQEQHEMNANAKGIYNEGVQAGAEGNLDRAEQSFKQVIDIDPEAFQAIYNLGVVAERKGNDSVALKYYKKALDLQPDYIPVIVSASKLNIRLGKVDDALLLLRQKASDYPRVIPVLNCYADVLIASRKYADAIDVAKQALRLNERNAFAMLRVAKANFMLGRYELAESVFDQLIEIDQNVAEVFFIKALISLHDENILEAISLFEMALQKKPYYVEAMNNLAVQFILSGNYQPAVEQLEKAINLSPSWGMLYLNYGNALRGAGQWQKSRVALERAQKLDSDLVGALFNLGVLYYVSTELDNLDQKSRWDEAQKYFAMYKSEMGSALKKEDLVYKYQKEVKIRIDRIEQRERQLKKQAELEKKRVAEREAAKNSDAGAVAGDDEENDNGDGWGDEEDAEGEGWE